MANSKRDENRVPTLLGVSSVDSSTPVAIEADATEKALHVYIKGGGLVSEGEDLRVDDTTTSNMIYIGYADMGTATSASSWKIKRVNKTSGVVVTWADDNDNYDNKWDDRASLDY